MLRFILHCVLNLQNFIPMESSYRKDNLFCPFLLSVDMAVELQ